MPSVRNPPNAKAIWSDLIEVITANAAATRIRRTASERETGASASSGVRGQCGREAFPKDPTAQRPVDGAFAAPVGHAGYLSTCVELAIIQFSASSLVAKPSIRRSCPSWYLMTTCQPLPSLSGKGSITGSSSVSAMGIVCVISVPVSSRSMPADFRIAPSRLPSIGRAVPPIRLSTTNGFASSPSPLCESTVAISVLAKPHGGWRAILHVNSRARCTRYNNR
jgi:hypothetical protein